jgi:predicted metal-dependent phosphoesterase TrpH
MVVEWYKTNGYHFLALSDHNIVLAGEKWIALTNNRGGEKALAKYLQRFGQKWVDLKTMQSTQMVRLRPLAEFRRMFEQRERFLLIPSEEISDDFKKVPIHVNATNLRDFIRPRSGTNILSVIQRNVDAVIEQHEKSRRPMFPHVNHPNFGWAITAEDLMRVRGDRFFEVYNGHPDVRNQGDAYHASTERVWDILLAFRLAELKLEPMFALAVDDSHQYHTVNRTNSNPGRGWVMVRAARLTPEALMAALEAGDFYATSGVRLKDVRREANRLSLVIDAEPGVTYTTQFIGTRKNFDRASEPGDLPPKSVRPVTRRYSRDIGTVLAEVPGLTASYQLQGNELYVRAKVSSSRLKTNSSVVNETEAAWTQPLVAAE